MFDEPEFELDAEATGIGSKSTNGCTELLFDAVASDIDGRLKKLHRYASRAIADELGASDDDAACCCCCVFHEMHDA